MTKLREIADKLGLPIEKEFRLDDEQFNKLVFKIDEEGNILFWNDNTVKFVLSSWSLIDIYTKGYVLVDEFKISEYAIEDSKYYANIYQVLKDYSGELSESISLAKDVIAIHSFKQLKSRVVQLIEETERRLLNK